MSQAKLSSQTPLSTHSVCGLSAALSQHELEEGNLMRLALDSKFYLL